ncbi:MAG: hypothetical protein J5979_05000 [Lachnospiraceae bacterium]|nr:hypothetical protein [Lachnospiraceae bacterium]
MKAELKTESVNQVLKDTDIYEQGDAVTSVALVVKGRIQVHSRGMNLLVGSGSFLGISDVNRGVHRMTYTAQTNAVIYVFSVSGSIKDIQKIIQINKDYGALMVSNMSKVLSEAARIYQEMQSAVEDIFVFLHKAHQTYQEIAQNTGLNIGEVYGIENLQPFETEQQVSIEKLRYYQACSRVALEIQKAYFGASIDICLYHVTDQIELFHQVHEQCLHYAEYLENALEPLILNRQSLYSMVAKLAGSIQRMGEDSSQVLGELDQIIDHINILETILAEKADIQTNIDRNFMEETYFSLLNPGAEKGKPSADADLALVDNVMMDASQLCNTLDSILEYSGVDAETVQSFTSLIDQFAAMPDKESTEDDARKLRREISKAYYKIYKKVFLKDYQSQEDTPIEIDLFLRYGFLSETLLSDQLIEELLALDRTHNSFGGCKVFDMKEWLTAILKGEREPSKNEFDMDYDEFLRDQRKNNAITPQQQEALSNSREHKLDFEINNMFRVNHRLVSGQITIFVPFLYTEGCGSSLERMFLSKDKINAAINRIHRIDFSAFYRESLYTKEIEGIKKEFIQQEIYPDVIVLPTTGSRGIMWQELSGRRRNSPGRFLLPVFMEGDLDKTLIRLVGGFRWELCRTMQGAYWNNIQSKSLTSEYSDFLQFYRKNKDLSDDKKEKLKLQIQKNRNNTREIFATDYENWIRHEAKGGIVLSKPVREILATYCPFAADIRESVENQPIFRDAMARFNRERSKKNKEYELKFRIWEKDKVQVPEEIVATRDFYRDL